MVKQPPGRTQRSKGVKVKHVLQICFLLAICFWLLYQVKHSHDKKKEFDEGNDRISQQKQSSSEVLKLGRKDLNPRVQDTATTTNQEEEEEEEEGEEQIAGEEEIKSEEEDLEDKKSEEKGDERRGAGDDNTDENVEDHEYVIEEEKDMEVGDEKENKEKDSEDNDGQLDNEISLDEEHDDDEQAHEAREELYKADDASSAMTHETEVVAAENGNGSLEKSNVVNKTIESKVGEESGSGVEDRSLTENGGPLKTTDKMDVENVESKPDDGSNDHLKSANGTLESENAARSWSTQSETEKESDFSQAGNLTTEGAISEYASTMNLKLGLGSNISLSSTENRADSNLTTDSNSGEVAMTNNSTWSTMPLKLVNSSTEGKDSSGATFADSNNAGEAAESEDGSNAGTSDDALESENPEEFQADLIDSSDSSIGLQEKEVRADLETLPEMQIEGTNDDDAAAEQKIEE